MKISGKILLLSLCLSLSFVFSPQAFGADAVIYGDSQHNPEAQRRIVQAILSFKPSIVFRVGDLVNNGNDPALWKAFSDIHGPLLETSEYFPALGNHEYHSPLYFEKFPFLHNRRWYSVDRIGIHFIVLDSNSRLDLGSEQCKWLESDLAGLKDQVKFIIAIFHHPLFDVGGRHISDERGLKPVLLPVFERYGVSAVFSGHSHNYQRFEHNGIYFIVSGGGGSILDKCSRSDPYLQKCSSTYHFCLLIPEDDSLRVRAIGAGSNIIDEFKITARAVNYAVHDGREDEK